MTEAAAAQTAVLEPTEALPLPGSLPAHWLRVDSMDLEAQGVARRADGKVVFIDGALPTEWVSAQTRRSNCLLYTSPSPRDS